MVTVDHGAPLPAMLFPKARRAVLGLLFEHPQRAFYLRQISELTGVGIGPVQREVKRLAKAGIIRRTDQGRHVYFQADDTCPVFDELRGLVIKTMGASRLLRAALRPLADRIRVAFIYGSVARGEETSASDIDLMVIGDLRLSDVVSAIRPAEAELRREVNPTMYPVAEFRKKVRAKHHFLETVIRGDKLYLIGDADELGKLFE